jgi:hypothetical protein
LNAVLNVFQLEASWIFFEHTFKDNNDEYLTRKIVPRKELDNVFMELFERDKTVVVSLDKHAPAQNENTDDAISTENELSSQLMLRIYNAIKNSSPTPPTLEMENKLMKLEIIRLRYEKEQSAKLIEWESRPKDWN